MRPFLYDDFFHSLEENHWWFVGRRRIVFDLIQRYVPRLARILDAGCGTGYTAREFARFGEVFAFDAAPEAVAYAAARGLAVRQGEITAIPYTNEYFDLVTALDVLEHIEDDRQALSELSRVLKPGGILLLTVPACPFLWSPHDEVNHHKRRYTAREFRVKVQEAGFYILKLSHYNTCLFAPILLARLFRRLFPARQEEKRSDFSLVQRGVLNTLLTRVFSAEAHLLRYVDLPFGVSLVGVVKKADQKLNADG